MASIELDWDNDALPSPAEDAQFLANVHRLTVELVAEKGPGGGNPLFRFTGSNSDLCALLRDYTDGDEQEAVVLMEGIEE